MPTPDTPTATPTEPHRTLESWAQSWPETISLGDAAADIDFDLWDDVDLVLVKTLVPVHGPAQPARRHRTLEAAIAAMAANDAEDRFGRLEDGLAAGAHHVPPIVLLPGEGMRDGHHRLALAERLGLTHLPAYQPVPG